MDAAAAPRLRPSLGTSARRFTSISTFREPARSRLQEVFDRVNGAVERNTRLFPADLAARPGQGIWFKLTDWQASAEGLVDPGSQRRGRITEDFRIAPFFDHVKANEGGY